MNIASWGLVAASCGLASQDRTVEQLVERLRSDRVEERREAARELNKLDEAALPALVKATRDPDAEVSRAAQEILGEIKARAAEKDFRRIEKALDETKSLKVKFTLELIEKRSDQEKHIAASGELSTKGTNKVFLLIRVPALPRETRFINDGTRMGTWRDGEKLGAAQPSSPDSSGRLTTGLLRAGIASADRILERQAKETDLKKVLVLSDFKTGPDEGEAKTLSFRCTPAGSREVQDVTLRYDPKTYRLLGRKGVAHRPDGGSTTAVEKYEEFTLDADVPEDTFKLPEK